MARLAWAVFMAWLWQAGPVLAAQVNLSPSSIVSASAPFTTDYVASNVLDQQSGPTAELFAQHYWLSPDKTAAPVFFVIDLGSAMRLASAALFNTHNGSYGDRGTGAFTLLGGNAAPMPGGMITGATVLVDGALMAALDGTPVAQTFAIAAAAAFRYVEFVPSTTASAAKAASATAFGLNEIELFSAVAAPEPGSASCLGATVALLLLRARLRSRAPAPAGA